MNINSYAGYSNSILNPYAPVSNSQTVNGTQSTQAPSQDTLKEVSSQSSSNTVNDFNVKISQEARQISLDTTQTMNASSESGSLSSEQNTTATTETQQSQQTQQNQPAQETQQTQQLQRTQQMQQEQQNQSQFYQSPYGQIPLSRSSVDLVA